MENQSDTTKMVEKNTIIIVKSKSVGVSLLLTFFFGPLGMLYSTISGAIIMFIISVIASFFTLGLSLFITWPICMIWGALAAADHNKSIKIHHK